MNPESLLYTEKDGTRSSLQDVVYDGLDNDYSDRYPSLLRLMREGEPKHRLHACYMLTSWGVPEGLQTLIVWARDPNSTPWAGEPVTYDRLFGADDAFELLADAVRVAQDAEPRAEVDAMRLEATRALLGIYDRAYFARTMMILLDMDDTLSASLQEEIASAVDRATQASLAPRQKFDMASQAAFLLSRLASLDDTQAARAADKLLAAHPDHSRMLREVAHALGSGSGPNTRAVLERLAESPYASVRADALDSLSRRGQ